MRKLYLLAMCICFIFFSGMVAYGSESNGAEKEDILSKEQIIKLANHQLKDFFSEKSAVIPDRDHIIDFYGVDDTIIAYCIPLSEGYMIYDAKKNGFGLLETVNSKETSKEISKRAKNEKLYYIFPSVIFSREELDSYLRDADINKIREQQNLIPEDYEMSIDEYIETLDEIESDEGYEIAEKESDHDYFLSMCMDVIKSYTGNGLEEADNRQRDWKSVTAANILAYMIWNDSSCRILLPICIRLCLM